MLKPIKSTTSTQATEATEASDAIRPISEQRPGQTLRDRLYELPVISGKKKSAVASGSGQSPTLYQSYSVAKSLPATPLTPLPSAAPGSTFSNFANKFTSYADYWAGLGAFQKPESQKEFVADKWGTAYIDPSLKPYMDRYGLERGVGFLESLAKADKLQANRQNPFFQPIMLNDMKEYFEEGLDKNAARTAMGKGFKFSRAWALNEAEISSLRKVAEDNNLGQAGFEDLLHKTYLKKKAGEFDRFTGMAIDALNNPDSTAWGELEKDISFMNYLKLSDIGGGEIVKMLNSAISSAGQEAVAGVGSSALSELLNKGARTSLGGGGVGGNVVKIVGQMLDSWIDAEHQKDVANFQFRMITDSGKLKSKIEDFSADERRKIEDFRGYMKKKEIDISAQNIVDFFKAATAASLYNRANELQKDKALAESEMGVEGAVQFGDSGLSLSKTVNPYGGK